MPSSHLSRETVEGWRRHSLPPDQLLDAADHLATCESCRAQLAASEEPGRSTAAPLAFLRDDLRAAAEADLEHPEYEQLRAYLDGTLDDVDREILGSHFELCEACRAELQDLRAFRAVVSTYPAREHRPDAPAPWWARLFGGAHRGVLPRVFLAAGSCAAVLVLFLVVRPDRGGSGPVVALSDGVGRITLDRQGRVAGLPELPDDLAASIGDAIRTHRLDRPAVLDEVQPVVASTSPAAFKVDAPVATVVAATQPEWAWDLPAGAESCKVILASVDGQRRVETEPLTKDRWKPKKPLAPGKVYQWQVVALSGRGSEVSRTPDRPDTARFKVLEPERVAAVEKTRGLAGRSHLAMGVLYTREGLLDDAERELDALVRLNAGVDLPVSLQQSVRSMRGRPDTPRAARLRFRGAHPRSPWTVARHGGPPRDRIVR